jgi:hypothetical protein
LSHFTVERACAEIGYKHFGEIKRSLVNVITGSSGDENDEAPSSTFTSQGVDFLLSARYFSCCRVNLFVKGGVIALRTKLEQNNFISSRNPSFNGEGYLGYTEYTFFNLAPEWVLGVGYLWGECVNITLSYTHIGSDFSGLPNYSVDGILDLPGGCPGYQMVGLGVEYAF